MNKSVIKNVAIILILILLVSGGCSGTDSSNNFHKLLKLIPSEFQYSEYPMTIINHASYLADNDISPNKPSGEPMTFREYYEMISNDEAGKYSANGFDITGYGRYALEVGTINDKNVGYNFTCVDAEIEAGGPPSNVVAAVGRFDPQATKDALSHQEDWLPSIVEKYTMEEYLGVTIHSWGNGLEVDLRAVLTPPHLDQIGRAKPLAVTEEYLFYAPTLDGIKLMIDASKDKKKSLADLRQFSSIADGLFEMNAYMALIGNEQYANGDPDYEGIYPGPELKKFVTFGSGLGEDEKGTYMALVIYHENQNDAKANVSLFEQRIANTDFMQAEKPWREIFDETDIRAEGNTLKAKLYTKHIHIWASWFYDLEPLLLHE